MTLLGGGARAYLGTCSHYEKNRRFDICLQKLLGLSLTCSRKNHAIIDQWNRARSLINSNVNNLRFVRSPILSCFFQQDHKVYRPANNSKGRWTSLFKQIFYVQQNKLQEDPRGERIRFSANQQTIAEKMLANNCWKNDNDFLKCSFIFLARFNNHDNIKEWIHIQSMNLGRISIHSVCLSLSELFRN